MVQDGGTNNYYKLTPDINGNYATGTWTQLKSTIPTWAPLYMGSEVMPDGRVYVIGGEYNDGQPAWTGQSGVYDPAKDTWTMLTSPWSGSGDTATAVLPNGLVYIANAISNDTAAFNPSTNAYIHPYGQQSPTYNNEAGLTLLPNGDLFRVNCWTSAQAQVFNTTSLTWDVMNMPYNVADLSSAEVGPAIVQYNGQVIQFGGNGANVIYEPSTNQFLSAPSFPTISGTQLKMDDGPAVLLPNGDVLTEVNGGNPYFFLWNGSTLTQVPGPSGVYLGAPFAGEFLLLPSGQAFLCLQNGYVELYTPAGSPQAAWAPTITSCPSQLHLGNNYTMSGTQFNGYSQGAAYGDDDQSNTNYPLIRITMQKTGHVFYAKEYSPSTMAIATGSATVSTHFTVPEDTELGNATVQVVTNGIPSKPFAVEILPPLLPYAVSVYPGQGTDPMGDLEDVFAVDGLYYSDESELFTQYEAAAIEADFNAGAGISTIRIFASSVAPAGVTEQLFAYNWTTGNFDFVTQATFGSGETPITGSPTTKNSEYVSATGIVRVIVRGLRPTHVSASSFRLNVDFVGLAFG